ncbi:hypothetical protein [Spartinivicinus poritis]|uniref:Uncharacterized protein n=1 Tax=Spartinivicinus poritis TaxID=2994640 RepID=A0ABT5UD92_9GAMM|nr:hypothetical protein [Spartinivicinus sp. A2-2]MDE1463423.1 hypothetical protein [Spartinivicinus sp. A2-2]
MMEGVALAQERASLSRARWEPGNKPDPFCSDNRQISHKSFNTLVAEYAIEQLVPQLCAQGLHMPASLQDARQLEPVGLDQQPLINSVEQLNYLAKLHHAKVKLDYDKLARHQWLPEYNPMLLGYFNPAKRRLLAAMLDSLCYDFQHLFRPVSLIAGVYETTHWGRMPTGELMLANLQRISLGNPALDLAGTFVHLPTVDNCYQMAQAYLQVNPQFKRNINQLTVDILAAAVWLKVDKCRLVCLGLDEFSVTEETFYFEQVSQWLVALMNK